MTDIRYVDADTQLPALVLAAQAFERDGVVEVAGVGAVDGEGGDLAQVETTLELVLAHFLRHRPGFLEYFLLELLVQAELDDDRAGLDLGVVPFSQVLLDHAERFFLARILRP